MSTPTKADMMPLMGQKGAPAKFKGHYEEVKRFIKHFNRLCKAYGVTDDKEKCSRVVDYCSTRVVKLIEALTSYQTGNWGELEKDLLSYYDAALKDTRYVVRDLMALTRTWKTKPIKTLTKWKQYERKFTTIAGWLETQKKITADEKASYFWHGINKTLKEVIEIRLITGAKPLDVKSPFPIDRITAVAETLFERNRFDVNFADTDADIPGRYEDSDADSTDESSDEEDDNSDAELRIKIKKLTKRIHKKKLRKYITDSDDEEPVKKNSKKFLDKRESTRKPPQDKKSSSAYDDVEDLIQQMSKLSLDDQRYGLLYYKALKLDPDIKQCVKAPQIQTTLSSQNRPSNRPGTLITSKPSLPTPTSMPNINREPAQCYGCGNKGHNMQACYRINDLIRTGVIARQNGRLANSDGTPIRRQTGETFVQAAERYQNEKNSQAQSHFFALGDSYSDYYVTDIDNDDDEDTHYIMPAFKIQPSYDDTYVMAAERTPRKITTARKEVLDGVYPPPRHHLKGKENTDPKAKATPPVPTGPIKFGPARTQGQPPSRLQPIPPTNTKVPTQFPVDARPKRIIPIDVDDDVNMKDGTKSQPKFTTIKNTPKDNPPVTASKPKPPLRQSEISSNIGDHQVVNQILDTPVTLRVREVLASSKELSDQITDMLKRQNPKPATNLVAELQSRQHPMDNAVHHIAQLTTLRRVNIVNFTLTYSEFHRETTDIVKWNFRYFLS